MKKLLVLTLFVCSAVSALAQHGFALHGKGRGATIGEVTINAARVGDNVRGTFTAWVQTTDGRLGLRGHVVRLAADPTTPRQFNFVAECLGSDNTRYRVEGVCVDGANPERDDITFVVSNANSGVFRGSTDRQVVSVRRINR